MSNLESALGAIKRMIEKAIRADGVSGKNNLIRSQEPICKLHDAVKQEFVDRGVNKKLIHPPLRQHSDELRLYGHFKAKDQDISILPNNRKPKSEIISSDGILYGVEDPYGKTLTERILSINVRSQLSSSAKNFDTLYERTFAEPLNLHLRCPKMVNGEVYMIPVYEYDDQFAKLNRVKFKDKPNNIEKYIRAFSIINGRTDYKEDPYKYERVCLLIVDFSKQTPKIYNTNQDLIDDGLLSPDSNASIDNLSFDSFADDLLGIYAERFGSDKFN